MLRKKNDILLKSAFEETFPDLLRFCFANADEIFDMKQEPVFLDKELSELFPELEKQGGNRFVDMLAKVFQKTVKRNGFWFISRFREVMIKSLQSVCFNTGTESMTGIKLK